MRVWYKYELDPARRGVQRVGPDAGFNDHRRSMGGYAADEAYRSKEEFFNKYFHGYGWGRLECYDDFLRRHLRRGQRVLSVASGRCANELRLLDEGYDITCSDLEPPDSYEAAAGLFGGLTFRKLDILAGPPKDRFDAVISLSLIYLFDAEALDRFFRNVAVGLAPGGLLLLDSAGAPDNPWTRFYHGVYLPAETRLKRLLKFALTGRWEGFVVKKFGYFRSDKDIRAAAERAGFERIDQRNYAYAHEFRRSFIFGRLMEIPGVETVLGVIGRAFPYVRMFAFRKKGEK